MSISMFNLICLSLIVLSKYFWHILPSTLFNKEYNKEYNTVYVNKKFKQAGAEIKIG